MTAPADRPEPSEASPPDRYAPPPETVTAVFVNGHTAHLLTCVTCGALIAQDTRLWRSIGSGPAVRAHNAWHQKFAALGKA